MRPFQLSLFAALSLASVARADTPTFANSFPTSPFGIGADYHTKTGFGGILAGNAPWNKLDARGTMPVHNLTAWSAYVTELVTHVHGRIKYWEVWNEPPNGTGRTQTAADYARLVVASYDAVEAVDPDCRIG